MFILSAYESVDRLREALKLNMINYLTKPLSIDSLKETLHICLKKIKFYDNKIDMIARDTHYNRFNKTIFYNEKTIPLTRNEIKAIEMFLNNKNRVISYEEMESHIFKNDNSINVVAIKNLIYRIRKKLPNVDIDNIVDVGYIFKID
jgi:DNA-binding response OmpR family regulator